MDCVPVGATRGLRWGCLALATVVAMLSVTSDPAEARSKRKRYHAKKHHPVQSYNPAYAALVIDAKTGATLHQANADSLRHPASLTKIMTLYLLFERLEAGKIRLNTPLDVSAEASIQAPTKLGLRPGQTLTVEDAIGGLVTKSANDAAVVVAEALGGSEEEFAELMTRKARALGMSRTVYRNASGLPNDEQVTTARDQALLGLAIQERFPRYYKYFAMKSYDYHGRAMRNHNKLLGRVEGIDGIKTGYTRASGFNLVTSMRRGERHIIAVVLGGRSGGSRDARMRELVVAHIGDASTKRTVAIAEAPAAKPDTAQAPAARMRLASTTDEPIALSAPQTIDSTAAIAGQHPGSKDPIKPVRVKTLAVKFVPPKLSSKDKQASQDKPAMTLQTAVLTSEPVPALEPAPAPPKARSGILGSLPSIVSSAEAAPAQPAAEPRIAPASRHIKRGGWAIQIGAYEDESEAKDRISSAQTKAARLLGKADSYTERTTKGDKTYYRARFAGFDKDQAHAICKQLKRNEITCMALKN